MIVTDMKDIFNSDWKDILFNVIVSVILISAISFLFGVWIRQIQELLDYQIIIYTTMKLLQV